MIRFTVYGKAEPAGSKSAWVPTNKQGEPFRSPGGRIAVNIVDANPRAKAWKKTVAIAGSAAYHGVLLDGPLAVKFTFYVERPKYHFGTGKNAEIVKASSPAYPAVAPDVLKLTRGAEDALTGVIWTDDALIVREVIEKFYADHGEPRVVISVARLPATVADLAAASVTENQSSKGVPACSSSVDAKTKQSSLPFQPVS